MMCRTQRRNSVNSGRNSQRRSPRQFNQSDQSMSPYMRYLPQRNEDTADQGIIEERLKDAVVWDAEIDVRSSPPCVKSIKKLAINGKYYNVYETVLLQLYNQLQSVLVQKMSNPVQVFQCNQPSLGEWLQHCNTFIKKKLCTVKISEACEGAGLDISSLAAAIGKLH